jgi:hypothetical protein
MKRLLAVFADKLVNAFAPVVSQRSFEQMRTDDWLADVEADHDSWAPDELWAAQHKLTDPHNPPCGCVSVTPAAAVVTSAGSAGGGGHLRDELIEELVDEYRAKLYKWFR